MYIKTLLLRGFKTFADKTEILLDANGGVTAIVGPNGCGKSNIVDAIRWVLGEQSSKNIRTENLEEIIFAGSALRKPLSMAEIELQIENADGVLPLEFSEIAIKRRVFRDCESEFFINKSPCRLKDIKDLFLDTGLGGGTYSIISQGQVDAILSSKPEDRRAIFEEAAGINKYKTRKGAAERKLFNADQNLLRLSDLKSEVSMQVSILEEQAEKASRYLQMKEQLKGLEIGLCKKQLGRFLEQKNQIFSKIDELKKAAEQSVFAERQLEEKKVELRLNIRSVEARERELRLALSGETENPLKLQIFDRNAELADKNNARRDLDEKIRFAKFEIDRNSNSMAALSERLAVLTAEVPALVSVLEITNRKLMECKESASDQTMQKEAFEQEEEQILSSILSLAKDIFDKLSALSASFAGDFFNADTVMADKNAAILGFGEKIGGILQELKDGTVVLEKLIDRKNNFKKVAGEEAEKEADLRVTKAEAEVKLTNFNLEIERIQFEIDNLTRGSKLRNDEISQAENDKTSLLAEIAAIEQALSGLNAEFSAARSSVSRELESWAAQREKLEAELDQLDGAGAGDSQRLANEELMKAEIALAKLEGENTAVSNKLLEEYGLTVEEAMATAYEVSSVARAKEEIENLRFSLRELEPVNLLSIDELKRTNERVAFINEQHADLIAAKANLQNLVAELDAKAQEAFVRTIDSVNRNFQEIFASLFEGGEAKIVLGEGADALSAGVEIIARPRGRKWLSLALLSGGEKSLTAIAILFSLLKTHPSPFCFLDEVDAALDDANVRRFTKMLREFAKTIQMVVITHNKRTMEAADVIYGITMEEPGISKVISMKLSAVAV